MSRSRFLDWLDDRTGYRAVARAALHEPVPGGAQWRYVWGSALVFTLFVQIVTGLVLWAAYSPSAQTAWESVYYIQHQMPGGWLVRGVHHYAAYVLIALVVVHLAQVVVGGAYRPPREVNFWLGVVMLPLVLACGFTGYLLPWDQRGYCAAKVATNIVGLVPAVGASLQRLVVGGSDFGHHTLTRLLALHAGVLPGLLVLLVVLHVALFYRHGYTARQPCRKPDATFWPDQALRDVLACLAVVAVVMVLVMWHYPTRDADAPLAGQLGAKLDAPADPSENYPAARPEAYFLFLFQLLKYLEAFSPAIAGLVVPGLAMLLLAAMPILGRRRWGHRLNVAVLFVLLGGAGLLTGLALYDDYNGRTQHSRSYLESVAVARAQARRAVELAGSPAGIPVEGAVAMLRDDPETQGPKLFRQNCAACHSHVDPAGGRLDPLQTITAKEPSASNLYGIGSRAWAAGLLDPKQIAGPRYFGNTALADGEMANWVKENIGDVLASMDEAERAEMRRKIEDVTYAISSEAQLDHRGDAAGPDVAERIAAGHELIVNEFLCTDCHKFHDDGYLGTAPDLTGYASREWLRQLVSNPARDRFYGALNDRMPAFAPHDDPATNQLSPQQLQLIIDWLRGEWYTPSPAGAGPR
jgi:ubiquinol-cytochrome c reductase cytochrome b subunit